MQPENNPPAEETITPPPIASDVQQQAGRIQQREPSAPMPSPSSDIATKPTGTAFGAGGLSEGTDRNLCMLLHAAGAIFWFMPSLVIWLLKKHDSPAIAAHGREAINFQLTAFMVAVVFGFISFGILAFIAWFVSIIFSVIAAARASDGVVYHYPLTLRLIK